MSLIAVKVHLEKTKKQQQLMELVTGRNAQQEVNEILLKYINPHVPVDSGNLRKRENVRVTWAGISWLVPYAHYQYTGYVYGPNFPIKQNGQIIGWRSPKGKGSKYNTYRPLTYHTPGTGAHWGWYSLTSNEKRQAQSEITRMYKRRAKELGL